jgi:PIN domain nuclease of toxin-antitoxin system
LGSFAVIVLDTHIWVWWTHTAPQLPPAYLAYIQANEAQGIGISAISCWEVAKLVEYNRLTLPLPVADWLDQALAYPGVHLLELTPQIAVASTQLPGTFHRDPADQIIVATARVYDCPLVTLDGRIQNYPHVQIAP